VVAVRFEIVFHTPFRVASGLAGHGADATVDRDLLLPASSLKGLMRSAARDLLGIPEPWVARVYGQAQHSSPWSWSDAVLTAVAPDPVRPRARVQIEPGTSTVVEGALAVAEEVLAERGEFTMDATGWISADHRPGHEAVLTASARALTAVGGDRRRGLGWVSVRPVDPAWPVEVAAAAGHAARLAEALHSLGEPA
jgi:CRISPR/Cas system CSM-associated protein Csm3 (group 7 of RAMP superfamily)